MFIINPLLLLSNNSNLSEINNLFTITAILCTITLLYEKPKGVI